MIKNADLKRRLMEISFTHKLAHLGSVLTAVDIIEEIYATKNPLTFKAWDEPFILSSGHAGLALYVVIEKYYGINAEEILEHHGIHPDRCREHYLYCSTGSLGQGICIAVGIALANRNKNVYCLISDGECSEGSVHEALRIADEQKLNNLKVYVNFNGFGAYKSIDHLYLNPNVHDNLMLIQTNMDDYPEWLRGQKAHYVSMNEEQYKEMMEILK